MSETSSKTALEMIQERREALKEKHRKAEAAQAEIDLSALADAEEEHGYGSVESLPVKDFVAGCPTMAIVKSPGGTPFYKKYTDQVRNARGDAMKVGKAQEVLGESCMVYPPPGEVRDRMLAAFPGLYVSCAVRAVKFAELDAETEKKG